MFTLKSRAAVDNPLREHELTDEELATRDEKAKIAAAIEKRYKELLKEQIRQADPAQRLSDTACFKQAESEVRKVIARDKRAEALRAFKADVGSTMWRNRHLTGPWKAAAPYALIGEGAWAATQAGMSELGAAGIAIAGAAGTSAALWRWIKTAPVDYLNRFRAGMGLGSLLCSAAPLVPAGLSGQAALLLGGLLTVTGSAAKYWHDHAPAYPGTDGETTAQATDATSEAEVDVDGEAQDIIDAWAEFVAAEGQHLPGSKLGKPKAFDYGWSFEVKLVRSKQTIDDLRQRMPKISAALNYPEKDITVDEGRDQLHAILNVTTRSPETTYTGPVIVREGGDVFIEVGPYSDGKGVERWHVMSGQLSEKEFAKVLADTTGELAEKVAGSMHGGFVLGNKGAGKSRFLENIAIALRKLGIVTAFLDPQEGASSPALMKNADWPLRGLDSAAETAGNLLNLWRALREIVDLRQDENALAGFVGFQHTKERPAIAVIVEECHRAFGLINPETGNTFGYDFGEIDRIGRKLGICFIGATQDPTQDSFGGSTVLRRGMTDSNAYALRYTGTNANLAIASISTQPIASLPKNRGFGYNPSGERPHVAFRNRFSPGGVGKFFQNIPGNELDQMAAQAAGEPYLHRNEVEVQKLDEIRARMEARKNGTYTRNRTGGKPKGGEKAGTLLEFPIGTPPASTSTSTPQSEPATAKLTDAEQGVLAHLREQSMNATSMGQRQGISREAAGKHLRNLAAKGAAVKLEDGRYMARTPADA